MADENREIYPNAPLSLVAFELRFAPIPRLETDLWESVFEDLRDEYPILGPRPHREVELSPTGAVETLTGRRFLERKRTKAVVIAEDVITLETSAYHRFEEFCADIKRVLESVHSAAEIPSVQRAGLRYIDEISIPELVDSAPSDWTRFIREELLAPSAISSFGIEKYFAQMQLAVEDGLKVNCRIGLMDNPVVNPDGPLHIKKSPIGRFFLMDLDSYWEAPPDEFPEYELDQLLAKVDRLHAPIREVFENSITDELRERMRESDRDE